MPPLAPPSLTAFAAKICVPKAPEYISDWFPKESACTFSTSTDLTGCNVLVSTDAYMNKNYHTTMYLSTESPVKRLSDDSMFTYTATIRSNATWQLAAWEMPQDHEYQTVYQETDRISKGVVLVSNCVQWRIDHISKMCNNGFNIDVYGKCNVKGCNNIARQDRWDPAWVQNKHDILKKYKYAIAIENAIEDNYVTEKLYDPLITHTLPYYVGAPNVLQFVPHPDAVITNQTYLLQVLADDHLYKKHVELWRNESFNSYKRINTTATIVFDELCLNLTHMVL